MKYEWIVPIQVSGKENFTLIAVWTKRLPGMSYGKALYSALKEYENLIQNGPVIVMGDFNLDKRVPSSYTGVGGYNKIIDLFEGYDLKSCYHSISKEAFGSESKATYYHYSKSDRPFHLDYCFVSQHIIQGMKEFYIGSAEEYLPYSDHVPIAFEFTLGLTIAVGTSHTQECDVVYPSKVPVSSSNINNRIIISKDELIQEYFLEVDSKIATVEEIEEAINFIRELRVKRN